MLVTLFTSIDESPLKTGGEFSGILNMTRREFTGFEKWREGNCPGMLKWREGNWQGLKIDVRAIVGIC